MDLIDEQDRLDASQRWKDPEEGPDHPKARFNWLHNYIDFLARVKTYQKLRKDLTSEADLIIDTLPPGLRTQYAVRVSARRLAAASVRYNTCYQLVIDATRRYPGYYGMLALLVTAVAWHWFTLVILGLLLVISAITVPVSRAFGRANRLLVEALVGLAVFGGAVGYQRYTSGFTDAQVWNLIINPYVNLEYSLQSFDNWWLTVVWAGFFCLSTSLVQISQSLLNARQDRLLRRRNGVGLCTAKLARALTVLSSPMPESRSRDRSKFIELVEEAALDLRSSELASDPAIGNVDKIIWGRQWDEVARGIQAFGHQLALAKEDTVENLRAEVSTAVLSIVCGRFGDLPRVEQGPVPTGARIAAVWKGFRSLVGGLLPAGVVGSLAYFHIAIPDEFRSTLILIAVLWAALTILALLDPGFEKKLESSQKLFSTLRGGGGGG